MSAREVVPSPEQWAAIHAPGNVLVRAGAGSGKTEVLARRFVGLLAGDIAGHAPLKPEQIAAITFTEKATYDMRGRIAAVLDERIASEAREDLQAHLRRAKRTLALARISTIHAFCARVLRENAIDAGVDPQFEVIDEYETQTFATRVCEEALVDAVRGDNAGAIYLARSRRLRQLGFREGALEIAVRIVRETRRLGRPPQWLIEQAERTKAAIESQGREVARLAQQLCGLVDQLVSLRGVEGAAGTKLAELRRVWPGMRRTIWKFSADSEPAAADVLRSLCQLLPTAQASAVKEGVKAIHDLLVKNGAFGIKGKLVMAWGTQRGVGPTVTVARLMAKVAAAVDEACRNERLVTFDDLLVLTRDVLKHRSAAGERCRRQLSALLVDEYQDTDPVQDEIVELLTRVGPGETAPELFIVGDEKQSIYRFRGADVAVFNRLREPAPQALPLSENRRSTRNILNFVNALGAHAMGAGPPRAEDNEQADEGTRRAYRVEWSRDHVLKVLRGDEFNPPIEWIAGIIGDGSISDRREHEARALSQRILEFIRSGTMVVDARSGEQRAASFGDIAILLRAFSDVAIYERVLVDAGIDCYTVKGRGFFGCTEILDLTELLAAVNDSRDSLALAAALRSPLFALSDRTLFEMAFRIRERQGDGRGPSSLADLFDGPAPDFDWLSDGREESLRAWRILRELRSMRTRLPIVEVIESAIALTDFEAVVLGLRQGRQRVANLRKLVELARTFDAHRFFTFHDFITHLRQLTIEPPMEAQAQILGEGENVVRLMTVHQAKGLEFPIVIVADAGRREPNISPTPALDKENGLLVNDSVGSGRFEIPSTSIEQYRIRVHDEEAAESVRIMYVALTRARDYLIISEGADKKGWSEAIREVIGRPEIEQFATSGAERARIERDGLQIVLRRPSIEPRIEAEGRATLSGSDGEELAALARARSNFAVDAGRELVISPTALGDFERCPLQFHFRHGLGLAEGRVGAGADGGGDAAAMGTVAHAVLERLDFATERSALPTQVERLTQALGVVGGLDAEQCASIARDLTRYAAGLKPGTGATGREVPFFVKLGEGLFVRGQIDVLIDDGTTVTVRDYKYARAADEAHIYQVQMECYALAAALAYPGRRVAAEIIFLRDGVTSVPVTLPEVDAIRRRLQTLGHAVIDAGECGEYAKKPSSAAACRALRCGYVARCWG